MHALDTCFFYTSPRDMPINYKQDASEMPLAENKQLQ